MIDPLLPLALGMTRSKGAYALLLGSGVSRAAGIKTGWDIVVDLIRMVARHERATCDPSPEDWYQQTFGEEPNYSILLERLGLTAAERSALLRNYFEPTDEERERGEKVPTAAHHAIANLVAGGYVRVIITTNFDTLMEQALEVRGIMPGIIARPDDIDGVALPPVAPCTIIKVHGDYRDLRTRNTVTELASYDSRIEALLAQILSQYGLVVCGWSATWDPALREAVERSTQRRYSNYWTERGDLTAEARRLVEQFQAIILRITNADVFFNNLYEAIQSIELLSSQGSLDTAIAKASLKRYLDNRHDTRIGDLLMQQISAFRATTDAAAVPVTGVQYTGDELRARVARYEQVAQTILALMAAGCYWGKTDDTRHWQRCLDSLAVSGIMSGDTIWLRLMNYPTLLALYAGGIAAIAGESYFNLATLLRDTSVWNEDRRLPLIVSVQPHTVFYDRVAYDLNLGSRLLYPASEHLHTVLRDPLRDYLVHQGQYDEAFDRFEYFLGLVYADMNERQGGPIAGPYGRFAWRSQQGHLFDVVKTLKTEAEMAGERWAPLQAGLFNGSLSRFLELHAAYSSGIGTNVAQAMYRASY